MNTFVSRRIPVGDRRNFLITGFLLGTFLVASSLGQKAAGPIRLVPQERSQIRTEGMPANAKAVLAKMPDNFHHFGAVAGKASEAQVLTLQFAANTEITRISSTRDFEVMPSGSCAEGRSYMAASTCQLVVRFTPQGPGHRLGKLTIANGSSSKPAIIGLLGYSSFPVVSFTPSVITTVPATVSAGVGLINGAYNLAVDGGDSVYIADTGNGDVRYIDSSGVMRTLASSRTAPTGIAVDTFGEVYFDEPSANLFYEIYDYGPVVQINGSGTDTCTASAPCHFASEAVFNPGEIAIDGANNMFFVNANSGAVLSVVQPLPATFANLYNPFPYQETYPAGFGVDGNDNLYTVWANGGECQIIAQTAYDAENSIVAFTVAAGGRTCGFSGDGGKATGAEISATIGQITFDAAGDMYFTDQGNNRVRRVDAYTGIIRTIAGNGTNGYTGDSGPATSAELGSPNGIAVDSEGQVYILSHSAATGTPQVVRRVGITGTLVFPSTKSGVASPARLINVANTGNSTLTFVRDTITGVNASAFSVDPNTTSCNFAAGNYLYAGQNCQIGIIFKPAAVGAATATLNLVDNTVTGTNLVRLTGTGAAAAAVKFTAPTSSTLISSGSKVTMTAAVSSSYATPTGKVSFSVDGKLLATVALTSGTASAQTGSLAAGTHQLVASYSGDKYHTAAKTSETITVSK